ncbi:18899_t:CDS:2, partial [Dentiscutata erythropus]
IQYSINGHGGASIIQNCPFFGDISNSFLTFPNNNDLEDNNFPFSLPSSGFFNDNSGDMNLISSFGYENNNLVNTSLFSAFSEFNNDRSPFVIHRNNASFNDHNRDLVDSDISFSEDNCNDNSDNLNISRYQHNLYVNAYFDNWLSVDSFIHNYCLERGFGYQIFCNYKDPNDPIKIFSECEYYMTKKLYANRISWAKAYAPLQFNAGIQSTQSVESFNVIIKKSLNNTSTLCEVEEAINK